MAKVSNVPDFLTPLPKSTRSMTLPSRGVLYNEGALKNGKVTLTPMTLMEESIMTSGDTDATDTVLKKCVQESISIDTLLSADKFFIFMLLRAITYGTDYSFNWSCTADQTKGPNRGEPCGAKNRTTVQIPDDFRVKQLADEDTEPYMITLPESGKRIGFRLARAYDAKEIEQYERKITSLSESGVKRMGQSAEAFQLAKLLVVVDGNKITDNIAVEDIMSWVCSLSGRDVAHYRSQLEHFTPGMDTTVTLHCESCGAKHEMDLPLTIEFFRPKYSDSSGSVANEIRPDVPLDDELRGDPQDTSGGTPLVLREIEAREDGRSGDREHEVRADGQGNDRISRRG